MTNAIMDNYDEIIPERLEERLEEISLDYKKKLKDRSEREKESVDILRCTLKNKKELKICNENIVNEFCKTLEMNKEIGEYLGRCKLYVENFISKNDKTGLKKLQREEKELSQKREKNGQVLTILVEKEKSIVCVIGEYAELQKVLIDEYFSVYKDMFVDGEGEFIILGDIVDEYSSSIRLVDDTIDEIRQRHKDMGEKFRRTDKIIEYNLSKINNMMIDCVRPSEGMDGKNMVEIALLTKRIVNREHIKNTSKCFYQ